MATALDRKILLSQIDDAIGALVIDHPFFASLCMHLKPIANSRIGTACTDGRTLQVNHDWFNDLSEPERSAIAAHEGLHCGLGHAFRCGDRDQSDFNIASDHEINILLKDAGFTLPKDAHCNMAFRNMSAEEIYAIIHKEPEDNGPGDDEQEQPEDEQEEGESETEGDALGGSSNEPGEAGDGDSDEGEGNGQPGAGDGDAEGNTDSVIEPGQAGADCGGMGSFCLPGPQDGLSEAPSQTELDDLKRDWEIAVEQAHNAAKACGHGSADIERIARENKRSTVDWRAQLAEWMTARRPTDTTWSRPNRRFIGAGLYLPSLGAPAMGPIFILADVSGSVGQPELDATAGVINGVAETVLPEFVEVAYWDTAVKRVERFGPEELPFKMIALGGGGTDPRPAFAHVEAVMAAEDITPACIIVVTDMYISSYPAQPAIPVLWVSTTEHKAPWGETIHLKL